MKIQGEHTFDAPRAAVWEALLDPGVLSRALPGCEKLERVEENRFQGALRVQVGPVRGQFAGTLELADLEPLEGYHMKLEGSGPSGFMTGEGTLRLTDAPGGGTVLAYDLDAQVGGRIAGVGQRLLDSSARVITQQGLEGFGREVAAMDAAAAGGEAPAAPPQAPSQARFAARFARGLAAELIPPERRPWVVGGALAVLAVLLVLLVRACGG